VRVMKPLVMQTVDVVVGEGKLQHPLGLVPNRKNAICA
jgi:hypothetical protein